jgi:hypothetical protein
MLIKTIEIMSKECINFKKVVETIRKNDPGCDGVLESFGLTTERGDEINDKTASDGPGELLGGPGTYTGMVANSLEYVVENTETDEEAIYLLFRLWQSFFGAMANHETNPLAALLDAMRDGR